MQSNRLKFYYLLKPYIPWSMRMWMRRRRAQKKRPLVENVWPIKPGTERPPVGWPGWPEGKQFAVVLTHDVEGPVGLSRIKPLMELEMSLGFRSCFNLIPEGPYTVTAELRNYITSHGFEVGVHDCHHDGRLFSSRTHFQACVPHINRYLREWNATGFRAGFMHHNLEWLHDLDIQYDCSTFDTDPFEPQPDGMDTIFPFFVPSRSSFFVDSRSSFVVDGRSSLPTVGSVPSEQRPTTKHAERRTGGDEARSTNENEERRTPANEEPRTSRNEEQLRGYVELPYTLPQDFTLFLLLAEGQADIWLKKLDWIAKHGGMALLNVHPDYLELDSRTPQCAVPLRAYEDLLRHISSRYRGAFWNANPGEVASSYSERSSLNQMKADLPSVASPASVSTRTCRAEKVKIWIDLDNTPHVPFFEPIIDSLKELGFSVLVTARNAFQVCDLADKMGLECLKVGRHYGKNPLRKAAGLAYRALQLAPTILREKPTLAVSHGARSQLLLSNLLRIPSILIEDYEYSRFPVMMRPTWLMTPTVIPDEVLCRKNGHIRKYHGIKEDVYAWKLHPDATVLKELGLRTSDIIVTVRPPATEAHYHNPASEKLFDSFMNRACRMPQVKVVLLPRNRKQAELIQAQSPQWFAHGKTVVPSGALDGMNLIWHSDLVVSGGGTMNREAAALGIPVYSIFRGTIGAVDKHLEAEGRLVLVESPADVERKINLVKRTPKPLSEVTSKRTLQEIVDTIREIAERIHPTYVLSHSRASEDRSLNPVLK